MINQDDIIYFVLTDRFYDGDSDNNHGTDKNDPRRYHGGDFKGITDRISYLKDLGITALWITPVYLNIGSFGDSDGYHGYWALDFERIDPHLYTERPEYYPGARQYLRDLCDCLHDNGIKLILDIVVNHTGYHNQTYREYCHNQISEKWFNTGGIGDKEAPLAGLPDLDHDNPDVRDYFVNNIVDWIEETGIDAIRMDTVKHVEDAFWYAFKSYVKGKHRTVTLIGEVLDPYDIGKIASYQTRHDFDTLFDFPLCSEIKNTFIHNASLTRLARPRLSHAEPGGVLDKDTVFYANANRLVTMLDNHDLPARIKTEILNRWGNWDRQRANRILKLCLTFLFTTRGIPQLYYGTEIGLEGDADPHNRRDMRWEIFEQDRAIHPEDTEARDALEIFEYTRNLIRIRKENPAISFGYLFTLYADNFLYAFMREYRQNTIIVVINNGLEDMPGPAEIDIGQNTNIPSRIKANLADRPLKNLLDPTDTLMYVDGKIQPWLAGKEARVYGVN